MDKYDRRRVLLCSFDCITKIYTANDHIYKLFDDMRMKV